MARAEISRETLGFTGTEPTYTAVDAADTAGGDKFANDGKTFCVVRNIDVADDLTATAVTGGTLGGLAVADVTLTVVHHATTMTIYGPFPMHVWNQPANGMINIDYTGTAAAITDSTIAVIH